MRGIGFTAIVSSLLATASHAAVVQLDIASVVNYDAVGTSSEINYANTFNAQPHNLGQILGDHSLTYVTAANRAFTNQASVTTGTAIPNNGTITAPGGNYQMSGPFEQNNAGVYSKVSNVLRLRAASTGANAIASQTITLGAGEQKKYEDLNILFVQGRSGSAATNAFYRTVLTANYATGPSQTLKDTGTVSIVTGSPAGGTFGSAAANNIDGGGLNYATDSNSEVTNVLNSIRGVRSGGSGNSVASIIDASGTFNLWQLTTRLDLDETRVLESLTFQVEARRSGSFNEFTLLGINATPVVPEPTAVALLAGGALAMAGRRRRRV